MSTQNMKVTVLSAQHVNVEGEDYCSLWVCEAVKDTHAEGAKGLSLMKMKMTLAAYTGLTLPPKPTPATVAVTLKKGAKQALVQVVESVTLDAAVK